MFVCASVSSFFNSSLHLQDKVNYIYTNGLYAMTSSNITDIPVVCYDPSEVAAEGEACSPTQPGTTQSYISCCVKNETASTHLYLLEQQCTRCGRYQPALFSQTILYCNDILCMRFILSDSPLLMI